MSEKLKEYKCDATPSEMRACMARSATEWKQKLEAELINNEIASCYWDPGQQV